LMGFLFIAVTVIILFVSYKYITNIDWQRNIQIFSTNLNPLIEP
jgi:hypothetical protein